MAKSGKNSSNSSRYETNPSVRLEEFLNSLRDMKSRYEEAYADVGEADVETQDILHAIEFSSTNIRPNAITKLIRNTRAKRRAAKVYREIVDPLVTWANANKRVIGELQGILGDMRKAETRAATRVYGPRTSILEE